MCYIASQLQEKAEKAAVRLNVRERAQLKLDFHAVSGFTHPNMLVIMGEQPLTLSLCRWGLIPSWCRDENKAKELQEYTLNAKSETIFEKPSFRAVNQQRCLIPLAGFYEWREFNKKKYPYYIYPKNADVFMVGGLYDNWTNEETGEILKTFSIITTAANPLMEKIHNIKKRMPLIIPEGKEPNWIDPALSKEGITALMKPFNESLMQAHTISKRITSRKDNPNVEEVKEPLTYDELSNV